MILLSDPRIAAIPSFDNEAPVVDLREVSELRLDGRLADDEGAFARLRSHVRDRLLAAQATLPAGIRLLIVECYRPPSLQQRYFSEYRDELATAHPHWDQQRLYVEASKFVSPPEVAPHCTGGTVDLTLCTTAGVELDMGTAVNASPVASGNACFTSAADISVEARRNRDILSAALTNVGMVNYPTEWWHWSYGDRYWALQTNAAATLYGAVELPLAVR